MGVTRIIILVVAAGAAGLTLLLMRNFLSNANTATAEAQPTANVETVEVLVATKGLHRGDKVAPGDLRWQAWPKEAMSESYIEAERVPEAMTNYVGAIVRADVERGEPVTDSKVIRLDGSGFMAAIIEPG